MWGPLSTPSEKELKDAGNVHGRLVRRKGLLARSLSWRELPLVGVKEQMPERGEGIS